MRICVAALGITLGPTFTWHTRALARGPIERGVLDGDLILQGGGEALHAALIKWIL